MATSTSGFATRSRLTATLGTPTIIALTMPIANVELSYAFPVGTQTFYIQHRTGGPIKIAFDSGDTSTSNYITVGRGCWLSQDQISQPLTLYYQSPNAGTVLEVLSWI